MMKCWRIKLCQKHWYPSKMRICVKMYAAVIKYFENRERFSRTTCRFLKCWWFSKLFMLLIKYVPVLEINFVGVKIRSKHSTQQRRAFFNCYFTRRNNGRAHQSIGKCFCFSCFDLTSQFSASASARHPEPARMLNVTRPLHKFGFVLPAQVYN